MGGRGVGLAGSAGEKAVEEKLVVLSHGSWRWCRWEAIGVGRGPAEAKIELARLVRLVLVLGLAVVSLRSEFCFLSRHNKTILSASSDSQNYSHNFPEWFKGEAAAVLLFLFFILTISLKNHSNHKKL